MFPEHASLWKKLRPIQRGILYPLNHGTVDVAIADLGRLTLVLLHGGLYADLDCTAGQPLDSFLKTIGFDETQHDASTS